MNIGFIGGGNMARSIIAGIISSGLYGPEKILVSTKTKESLIKIKEDYGVETSLDNQYIARNSDILVLAVKPHLYKDVALEIENFLEKDTILVSIAAGITIDKMETLFPAMKKIVKLMPNTPAMVGEGMTFVAFGEEVLPEDEEKIYPILDSIGSWVKLDESLIHGFTAVAGSGPAYIYMLMEAMADGAVLEGIPREEAYKIVGQTLVGSGKMLLETKDHPGLLKDRVCSPGGTTIEGLVALEEAGFRGAILKGLRACSEKSRRMTKD